MAKDGGEKEVLMDHDEEDVEMPGFRFHPTDEELVDFYLRRKVARKSFSIKIIREIDIYKYDPWDLPKSIAAGEKEWYFFCLRGRKYRNSIRPNRVTGSGFWKATGIDRPIYSSVRTGDCIGLKKSLVYYRGSAGKGTKTDWMMHEFRPPSSSKNTDNNSTSPTMQEAEIWTICRIFKRNVTYKKHNPQHWNSLAAAKQNPADSSSKTSSLESDSRNAHTHFLSSNHPRGEMKFASSYCGENDQLYSGQWNAVTQANSLTGLRHDNINAVNPNMELFKDGNWDELGRIMECMEDQTTVAYDCIYT